MKKIIILALGLSLTAASCNLFGGATGSKGVLKSQDNGVTFTTSNKISEKKNIEGVNVNILVVDPVESNTLYVGSSDGVFKSTNAAETWSHILAGMRIGDIAVDPSQNNVIYAAGISSTNGRIIKSTDGGNSWKDIYVEPTKNNPALSLAISRANTKIILAGLNNGEVLRSLDEGVTWQIVRDLANPITEMEYIDNTSAYALTLNNGLYVTYDQGSNWSPLVASITVAPTTDDQYRYTQATTRLYSDVAFDQKLKGVIFLATDQGLIRTVDNGVNWSIISLPVTDQSLAISSVAINPTNSNNILIAVGTTILKTNNGGLTWETKKLPTQQPVRHIVVNPQEPNIIYVGIGSR
jgi:photosystem II stability/assembly factor-like uncharacterized protein